MAILKENFSLRKYNTFNINVLCKYYFEYQTQEEICNFLLDNQLSGTEYLILGSGSNIVFTKDYDGLIIHPQIKGIEIIEEDEDYAFVKVGAGEIWDDFVLWAVENNLSGIENLSAIPGNVGSTPIQNIGAYGVEVSDCIDRVHTLSIEDNREISFSNSQCEFDYRNSVFKNEYKNMFIINHVTFKLNKKHIFKIHYGKIDLALKGKEINLSNIRETITSIRNSKLPDPKILGNAGSFFKNPIVSKQRIEDIKKTYKDMPSYEIDADNAKLAAGWLIEQAGWKGKNFGAVGVHKDQALVIINNGGANGMEIIKLANEISKSVFMKFGIKLEMEVMAV